MGHHNPTHLEGDIAEMARLGCDDVLLAAQENDFIHFTGKIKFTPQIAKDHGLRAIAIFWGALNLFGGGRSSQFLLEHPEGLQINAHGSRRSAGCYLNPACLARIKEMIDQIVDLGFKAYFVDEPAPLENCFCSSCRERFDAWYGSDLLSASDEVKKEFRNRCVIEYVETIADYCKSRYSGLETICCIEPSNSDLWEAAADIRALDNIGTDLYWVNSDRNVEEMRPILKDLDAICKRHGKSHHEWLQCWGVHTGSEGRIVKQGRIIIDERPDALYVWAWEGQIGTTESCDDPARAWSTAREVLRRAKALD